MEQQELIKFWLQSSDHENSDIDLALVISNIKDRICMQTELLKLGRGFDYIIEPHPFDKTEFNHLHPLTHEILTSGVRIV
jgi:hypothetical protein